MAWRLSENASLSPDTAPLGATPDRHGVNFALASVHAERVELCLFDDAGANEIARLHLRERSGDVWHGHVAGIGPGQRYGYRVYGPFDPVRGHRFNHHKLLIDPYARAIDRPFRLAPSLYGHIPGDPRGDLSFSTLDSAADMPKAVVTAPAPSRAASGPHVPWADTVVYELHARGFSRRHPALPHALRGTIAGLADPAIVEYLTGLGVTTLELLPLAAFIDERHLPPLGLRNYWGYNPITFLAPEPRYLGDGDDRIAAAVAALHAAGLEVIVDVVFNHSGESDELGPTVCYRGIDNASYYRLRADAPRYYENDTGCGNALALDRPLALRLAMDAMRHWVSAYGVDGFRFDLATTLARGDHGFDADGPFVAALRQDPLLSQVKLIAEPWDLGPGGYRAGEFPAGIAEWNDRYRDEVRQFWAGGSDVAALASRLAGSSDRFGRAGRKPADSLNFVTAHDGFTLADLVSYAGKHNAANGEDNRDGTDRNDSWNHGVEGPSDDAAIRAARDGDMRALLATLLFARGTPMLRAGDERAQSQGGNNNAYAQDNETTWLDWADAGTDTDLVGFVRRLLALRRAHPALRENRFLTGAPIGDGLFRDAVWRDENGDELAGDAWHDPARRCLCLELLTQAEREDDHVYLIVNGGADVQAVLPPARGAWRVALDSADPAATPHFTGATLHVAARSVVLLADDARALPQDRPEALARLARLAGIQPEHEDANGRRHRVTPDTQRALLAAMRLPAGDAAMVRDSLQALETAPWRAALPPFAIAAANRPWAIEIVVDSDAAGRMHEARVTVDDDDESCALPFRPSAGTLIDARRIDGRRLERWRVEFDRALPPGLHAIAVEDAAATLAATPERLYQPPLLDGAAKCWGVSTNLYGARRERDWGIGDFTTLGRIGAEVARRGGALVGVNPLHALFPDRPDRVSPYYPSDRRFLEAAYLDPYAVPGFAELAAGDPWFAAAEREAAQLRESTLIDYAAVYALKRAALGRLWPHFRDAGHAASADYRRFVAEGGAALQAFAAHQAAHAGDEAAFHVFLQYCADRGLASAAADAKLPLGFYRDLAVGPAPDGAEVAAQRDCFASGVSVGAPPDAYSDTGQVWGVPPYDPLALAQAGYRPWSALLRANMRHAGALRLDHVMGIERLLWVPHGASAEHGAYVRFDAAAMLAVLTIESHRQRCLVVGEDLGTVPHGFRERMSRAGLYTMSVVLFERDGARFRPSGDYAPSSVAAFGSHDLPPLQGWWARHRAEPDGLALRDAIGAADAVSTRLHAFLGAAGAKIAMAQLDDLAGETVQINVPGTTTEYPNWRHRMRADVDAVFADPRAETAIAALSAERGQSLAAAVAAQPSTATDHVS
jgi:glycogen debranching enzyme GlgX